MSSLVQGAEVLCGRFRLVRALGEGGMGVVWEVEEIATRQHLAIKFVRDEDRSEKATKRLRREAEASSAIAHPNIVRVHEVAEDSEGAAAIVMELLDGESLGARLAREGLLSVGQTAAILRRVVSALRAAHAAGVVHRDLKPDNIFLVTAPDGSVDVRVLDFGIAKHTRLPVETLTVTGAIMGTPMYMSPEQAEGEHGLDARTDVWSIAVIAFESLTGATPVSGDNFGQLLAHLIRGEITRLSDMRPTLPRDLIEVVDGALVGRDARSADLAPMELTLARHADAAIATFVPRVIVQSDPSLPVAASSNDSLLETQVALPAPRVEAAPRAPQPGKARMLAVGAALAALLVAGLVAAYAIGPRAEPSSLPTPTSALLASPGSSASEVAPPLPALTASVATEAPRSPSTAPRAGHAPRSSSAPRTSAPPAASTAPRRLQGGVAGDVPF